MDPQKNVNPATSDEDKDVSPQTDASQEPTSVTGDASAPVVADVNDVDSALKDPMATPEPGSDTPIGDGSAVGGDPTVGSPIEAAAPPVSTDASTDPADIALGDEPNAVSDSAAVTPTEAPVEASTDAPVPATMPEAPVADTAAATPDTTPAPDLGPVPTDSATPAPAGGTVTPGDDPASAVPNTAPLPATHGHGDKKTVFILMGVAIVLIVAIAVLYFM